MKEVTEHICNKQHPMPIEIADKVVELGQRWIHEDVEEIGETETKVFYHCLACGHHIIIDLGD